MLLSFASDSFYPNGTIFCPMGLMFVLQCQLGSQVCSCIGIWSGVITAARSNPAIDLPQSGIKCPIITCHKDFHLLSQCSKWLHQIPPVIAKMGSGQFTLELGIKWRHFANKNMKQVWTLLLDNYGTLISERSTIKIRRLMAPTSVCWGLKTSWCELIFNYEKDSSSAVPEKHETQWGFLNFTWILSITNLFLPVWFGAQTQVKVSSSRAPHLCSSSTNRNTK